MRKHYQTEEDAIAHLWDELGDIKGVDGAHFTVYRFVAGVLTIVVPNGFANDEPRILLRENEGLYWQVPDT